MNHNISPSPASTGIYGVPESPQQFQARIVEINRLELLLKLHALTADERDSLHRQIALLKGVNDNTLRSDND